MSIRSVKATLVAGCACLLVLAVLGWLMLLGPVVARIADTEEQQVQAQDRATQMATQLNAVRRLARELPDQEREARRLDRIFPSTADQPGFFAAVADAARGAGIGPDAITALSPGVPVLPEPPTAPAPTPGTTAPAPAPPPQLAVQDVSIVATGSYEQLTALLGGLEAMDRALLITSAGVRLDDDELELTLVGMTFVAAPLGDPPTL